MNKLKIRIIKIESALISTLLEPFSIHGYLIDDALYNSKSRYFAFDRKAIYY